MLSNVEKGFSVYTVCSDVFKYEMLEYMFLKF